MASKKTIKNWERFATPTEARNYFFNSEETKYYLKDMGLILFWLYMDYIPNESIDELLARSYIGMINAKGEKRLEKYLKGKQSK